MPYYACVNAKHNNQICWWFLKCRKAHSQACYWRGQKFFSGVRDIPKCIKAMVILIMGRANNFLGASSPCPLAMGMSQGCFSMFNCFLFDFMWPMYQSVHWLFSPGQVMLWNWPDFFSVNMVLKAFDWSDRKLYPF